jgi:hypothetical protein
MNPSKKVSLTAGWAVILLSQVTLSTPICAEDTRSASKWILQVIKVDPDDVNIEPAFRVAIYENLLVELTKGKEFQQVLREALSHCAGERAAWAGQRPVLRRGDG